MINLITGFPGASKTLNTIKEIIEDLEYTSRQVYYHNIKALMLDIDFSYSFAGWFYGTWLPSANESQLDKVLPIVRAVHKKSEVITEHHLPFLVCYWRQAEIYQTWVDWVFKLYPESKTRELKRFLAACDEFKFKPNKNRLKKFNLHWQNIKDPLTWHDLPYGSVIVIDEAQEYFPPRNAGSKVPLHISKMNTHRHSGFDLHLVTQQPRLLDTQIRAVTGRHIHFYNPDNGEKVVRYQSSKLMDVESDTSLKECLNLTYIARDKKFYGSYYSAEIHTHTKTRPDFYKKIIPSLLSIFVCIIALYYIFQKINNDLIESETEIQANDITQEVIPNEQINYDYQENNVLSDSQIPIGSRCIFVGERRICR